MERRCHGPRLPLGSRQSRARASPRRWRSCFSRSSRSSGPIPGSARPLWAPAHGRWGAVTGTRVTSTARDADRLRSCATPPGRSRVSSSTSTPSRAPPSSGWCPSATARTGRFFTSRRRAFARRRRTCCPTGPCSSPTRARRSSSVTRRRTWTCSWTTTCGTSSPRTLKSLTTRPTANAPSEPSCGG